MSTKPTFLEVEDDEQRGGRISALLERLNTSSSTAATPDSLLKIGRGGAPGPIEPPTELLARIQAFLPAISASNEALSRKNPEDIDIENIPEGVGQYIEMDLGLGLFEAKHLPNHESGVQQRSPPLSDADSTSGGSSASYELEADSDSSSSSSEEDSESDSDSSSSDDLDIGLRPGSSIGITAVPSRPIKPLPRRVSQQVRLEV